MSDSLLIFSDDTYDQTKILNENQFLMKGTAYRRHNLECQPNASPFFGKLPLSQPLYI